MKIILTSTAVLALAASAAIADGHQGNRGAASGMVSDIESVRTSPESSMREVTTSVSGGGKDGARGNSGWGNVTGVSGKQDDD